MFVIDYIKDIINRNIYGFIGLSIPYPEFIGVPENFFNNKKDIKDLFEKSDYTSLDEFISKEYISYDEYTNLIDIVIIPIKKYKYYKRDYIENIICNKLNISILEYDFLNDKNKNKYKKCNLYFFYKSYNKII